MGQVRRSAFASLIYPRFRAAKWPQTVLKAVFRVGESASQVGGGGEGGSEIKLAPYPRWELTEFLTFASRGSTTTEPGWAAGRHKFWKARPAFNRLMFNILY